MSPAASRYPVTARDPGASDVLTDGPTRSPRATAFLASSPAPIITVGLEVFVQDVIAAIATEPWRIVVGDAAHLDGHALRAPSSRSGRHR